MSLTVRHLNGDSTFLLIFSPNPHPTPFDLLSANGAYSVLIDPWIIGSSIVSAKWFAVTERVEPSSISHLSEIEEPDVVICSQNKPDHTHKETLLQLRPEAKTIIAAEPGAAREIKSWDYFDPNRVIPLIKYDHRARFGNSLRIYIPPLSADGQPGELVISFIPAKNYVTGLHNAIGITYQAPTKSKALAPVATVDLPKTRYFHLPMSPAPMLSSPSDQNYSMSSYQQSGMDDSQETVVPIKSTHRRSFGHRPQLSRSSNTASSELLSFPYQPSIRPSMEDLRNQRPNPEFSQRSEVFVGDDINHDFEFPSKPLTPPESPKATVRAAINTPSRVDLDTPKTSISSLSNTSEDLHLHDSRPLSSSHRPLTIHPARPKAVSVLYTPHGITTSDIRPYVQNHLIKLPGALPLTLLLHSFEYAQNPWYFGGNIMTGAAGGMAIAKTLMARCWISAHDEPKEKRGVSVKLLKCETMKVEDIRRDLALDDDGKGHGWTCDVRELPSGKQLTLSGSERDLLTGFVCEGVQQGLGLEDSLLMRSPSISAGK